jgi:hypothetical protein
MTYRNLYNILCVCAAAAFIMGAASMALFTLGYAMCFFLMAIFLQLQAMVARNAKEE